MGKRHHPDKDERTWRSFAALCAGVVLAWLLFIVAYEFVFAIDEPTSISIVEIKAYDGVLESSDLLVVVEYSLPYASIPTETISDAYLGRFLNGTSELKSIEPFPFNDKGYGTGIFSFYWTAAQKGTASIEFNNTNSESYKVTFQGKPGVFPGTVPSITSPSITWQDASSTSDLLFAHVEALARQFENDSGWNDDPDFDDLIESPGGVLQLTSTGVGSGEEYFSNAIPNLQSMIPSIFSSGTSSPDFSETPGDTSFEDDLNTFWSGNWVDTHFETLSTTFQAPKRTITALIAIFFMGLIAFFSANLMGANKEAPAFGLMTMSVTLPMFGAINFIPLNFVVVTAFTLGVLGIGWVLFLRRAGA